MTGVYIFVGLIALACSYYGMYWFFRKSMDSIRPVSGWSKEMDRHLACVFWPVMQFLYIPVILSTVIPWGLSKILGKAGSSLRNLAAKKDTSPTSILVGLIIQQALLDPDVFTSSYSNEAVWCKTVRDAEIKVSFRTTNGCLQELRVDGQTIPLGAEQGSRLGEGMKKAWEMREQFRVVKNKEKAEMASLEAVTKILGLPKPDAIPAPTLEHLQGTAPMPVSKLLTPEK